MKQFYATAFILYRHKYHFQLIAYILPISNHKYAVNHALQSHRVKPSI